MLYQVPTLLKTLPAIPMLSSPRVAAAGYMLAANVIYLARRSHLRDLTKRELLKIRVTKDRGVSWPRFFVFLLAWQGLVAVFPLVEPAARAAGRASFFYDYPNAQGFGFILEPLSVQHLSMSRRAKKQIRLDWHEITFNVGNVGRDGYRHPPAVQRNLPHVDIPARGMKHWPWKRRSRQAVTTESKCGGKNQKPG